MQIKSSQKSILLDLLSECAPDSSKNTLRSWVQMGRVTIDGKPAKFANQVVNDGQLVEVGRKSKYAREEVQILFEDEDLVVIDKPAGLLSVATDLEKERTAHAILKRRYHNRRVYPIHRLDQETSGLLVFAYNLKTREGLKKQLEDRSMVREYKALVHGHPGEGTWRHYLEEDALFRVQVSSRGKEAITHFRTIRKKGQCSLLAVRLETGRKHQIRVQASSSGFPIVGDEKYGLEQDSGKNLQLRAVSLSFIHPRGGRRMAFGAKSSAF